LHEAAVGGHVGVTSRLLLPLAAIAVLTGGCAYPYYSYPYWYYPPGFSSFAVVEQPPITDQPSPVQREVVYPHGRYVLSGDGVSQPWHWIWIPSASPPR
jgi:hypothetical protein